MQVSEIANAVGYKKNGILFKALQKIYGFLTASIPPHPEKHESPASGAGLL